MFKFCFLFFAKGIEPLLIAEGLQSEKLWTKGLYPYTKKPPA